MGVDRYREFGIFARQRVQDELRALGSPLAGLSVRLLPFDGPALAASAAWQQRRTDWDWSTVYRDFRSHQRRLEVAAWVGDNLFGMAVADASRGEGEHSNVTLHLIERDPSSANPLAGIITHIIIDVMDAYAILLDRQHLKVKNPAPHMRSIYIGLGFTDAPKIDAQTYMQRRVTAC